MSDAETTFPIRPAMLADMDAIDGLLGRSYPTLLKADYPPSILVTAIPRMTKAQPALIKSGTYYVAEDPGGTLLGAGGWTFALPGRGTMRERGRANVRHLVTDPERLRLGVARAIMQHCFAEARQAGATWMHCLATRTAVPFYTAVGFEVIGEVTVPLGPGVDFPAIAMQRTL